MLVKDSVCKCGGQCHQHEAQRDDDKRNRQVCLFTHRLTLTCTFTKFACDKHATDQDTEDDHDQEGHETVDENVEVVEEGL